MRNIEEKNKEKIEEGKIVKRFRKIEIENDAQINQDNKSDTFKTKEKREISEKRETDNREFKKRKDTSTNVTVEKSEIKNLQMGEIQHILKLTNRKPDKSQN